jgi:hypothetical protein
MRPKLVYLQTIIMGLFGFILYLADLSTFKTVVMLILTTALMSRMPIPRTRLILTSLTIQEWHP